MTQFKQGQVKEELDAGKIPKSILYFIHVLGRRIYNIFVIH
jgi:hypothetical protein